MWLLRDVRFIGADTMYTDGFPLDVWKAILCTDRPYRGVAARSESVRFMERTEEVEAAFFTSSTELFFSREIRAAIQRLIDSDPQFVPAHVAGYVLSLHAGGSRWVSLELWEKENMTE